MQGGNLTYFRRETFRLFHVRRSARVLQDLLMLNGSSRWDHGRRKILHTVMAKAKPSPTLVEMESKLGYRVNSSTYPDRNSERYYSDLRHIPESTYWKTREEFEEYERRIHRKDKRTIPEGALPELDMVKVSRS